MLALLVRWWFLWAGQRDGGVAGYDPPTYYTAAAALLHGRMPYHGDFVFVHPPLVILAGLPFALLGRLTSAPVGFTTACLAFGAMGAASVAGVTRVARAWGTSRLAAGTGGVVLAVWTVPVAAQGVLRLEPLGDLLLVVALLALGPPRVTPGAARLAVAGIALGLLVNVKVWWFAVLVAVLLLRVWRNRRWGEAGLLVLVAAATAVVLDLPFMLVARGRMVHSIITAQLDRAAAQGTPTGGVERYPVLVRLENVTGVADAGRRFLTEAHVFTSTSLHVLGLLVCLGFLATAVLALRTELGKLAVPLAALQVALVLAAPVYFGYYGDFTSVGVGLVVAAGIDAVSRGSASRVPALVSTGWVAVALLPMLLSATGSGLLGGGVAVSAADRRALVLPAQGCVVADGSRALVALDLVDRSLAPGCRNLVDVQAVGHGAGPDPAARVTLGVANQAWRRDLTAYLRSGPVLLLGDPYVRYLLGPRSTLAATGGRHPRRVGQVYVYGAR